ncbi:hypothetical protein V6615_12030 [Oscillospiraceae bacterium PP1C4]
MLFVAQNKNMVLQKSISNLGAQLLDVKTTTDETLGIATISGRRDGVRVSITIEFSELGVTQITSVYQSVPRKSDYKNEVKHLRDQGLTQKCIALRLGILQSLVSKLLNQ